MNTQTISKRFLGLFLILILSFLLILLVARGLTKTLNNLIQAQTSCSLESILEIRDQNNLVLSAQNNPDFSYEAGYTNIDGSEASNTPKSNGKFPSSAGVPIPSSVAVHYKTDNMPNSVKGLLAKVKVILPTSYTLAGESKDAFFCEKINSTDNNPSNCETLSSPILSQNSNPDGQTSQNVTFTNLLVTCNQKVRYGIRTKSSLSPLPTPDFSQTCPLEKISNSKLDFRLNLNSSIPSTRQLNLRIVPLDENQLPVSSQTFSLSLNSQGNEISGNFIKNIELGNILKKIDENGKSIGHFEKFALVLDKNLVVNSLGKKDVNINQNPLPLSTWGGSIDFTSCQTPQGIIGEYLKRVTTSNEISCIANLPKNCSLSLEAKIAIPPQMCGKPCQFGIEPIEGEYLCFSPLSPTPCPSGISCPFEQKISPVYRHKNCFKDPECSCAAPSIAPSGTSQISIRPLVTSASSSATLAPISTSPTPKIRIITALPNPTAGVTIFPTDAPQPSRTPSPRASITSQKPSPQATNIPTNTTAPSFSPSNAPPTKSLSPTLSISISKKPIAVSISPSGPPRTATIVIPPPRESIQNLFIFKNTSAQNVKKIQIDLCKSNTDCQNFTLSQNIAQNEALSLGNIFNVSSSQFYLLKCVITFADNSAKVCQSSPLNTTKDSPKRLILETNGEKIIPQSHALLPDLDLSKNLVIETTDFGLLVKDYQKTGSSLVADFNQDGIVNALDVSILISFLGDKVTTTISNTPTPFATQKIDIIQQRRL